LFVGLDIVGAGKVLGDEVVEDPQCTLLNIEKEAPDPVRAGDSGAAAVSMTRCGGFLPLLRLRDRISGNVGVGLRSR
jgi:hypothetical protein